MSRHVPPLSRLNAGSEYMADILPDAGLIKLDDLANWYEITPYILIKALLKRNIPILKTGKMHRQWSIRLEDLK
jgi:phage antirepressor YoqD-like protein